MANEKVATIHTGDDTEQTGSSQQSIANSPTDSDVATLEQIDQTREQTREERGEKEG